MANTNSGQQHSIMAVPSHLDPQTRNLLNQMRDAIIKKGTDPAQARTIPTLIVTPAALSNVLQWTMTDADSYTVFASRTNDISAASIIDVGNSNTFHHFVGNSGVTVFYWVQSIRSTVSVNSPPFGPKSGITLAAGATVTVPPPPPPSDAPAIDPGTGHVRPGGSKTDLP